jgi:hypothetical protein
MPVMVVPVMAVIRMHHNHDPGSCFRLRRRVNTGKHEQHCQSE